MVVPSAFISRKNSHIERRSSISTPAVGSSRISMRGSCTKARAIIKRRFIPPESILAAVSRLSHKPSFFRYLSARSEEHTSELQSRPHLVCRLLLEKKNIVDLNVIIVLVHI